MKKFCKDPVEEEDSENDNEKKQIDKKDDEIIVTGVALDDNQNRNTVYAPV